MPAINLDPVELTDAGRPVLDGHGESVLLTVSPAELQCEGFIGSRGRNAAGCKDGHCILTNRRIIWVEDGRTSGHKSCTVPVSAVRTVASASGVMSMMGFSPTVKVQIVILVNSRGEPATHGTETAAFHIKSTDVKGASAFRSRLRELISAGGGRTETGTDIAAQPAVYQPVEPLVPTPSAPQVDAQLLESLSVMGFPHARARAALAQAGNNMQAAVQWLFDNADRSDLELELECAASLPSTAGTPQGPAQPSTVPRRERSVHSFPVAAASADLSPPRGPPENATAPLPPPGYYGAAPMRRHVSEGLTQAPGPFESAAMINPLSRTHGHGPGGAAATPFTDAAAPSTRVVGVGGIIRHEKEVAQAQSSTVKQAFQDLQALMSKGQTMVQLARELRSRLGAQSAQTSAQTGSGDDAEVLMDPAMEQELIDLGIYSPVTRKEAGKRYEEELARQLCDFLRQPMRRAGGMMTLQEVFCLFNRARGTELVSPDDLKSAAQLCQQLGLSVHLRSFPSGVAVLQDATFSDDNICQRLLALFDNGEGAEHGASLGRGLTATRVATELVQPVPVATEQLLLAERRGVLCRDDGPDGLIFYKNFFNACVV